MSERISRRDFLKIVGGVGIGIAISNLDKLEIENPFNRSSPKDFVWRVELEDPLSFESVARIAERFKNTLDALPEPEIPINEDSAKAILWEYTNFFKENGAVERIFYPKEVVFEVLSPGRHSSVLGFSDCGEKIAFNVRQANPVSPWYGRSDWLWTVVHESAHLQQGREVCEEYSNFLSPSELLEATAELMTAEVFAFCANRRDKNAFYVLTDAVYGWAMGGLLSLAIRNKNIDAYKEFSERLSPGAMTRSVVDALLRKYQYRMTYLQEILDAYSLKPLELAIKATKDKYRMLEGLALPKRQDFNYGAGQPYVPVLVMDDFTYFVQNMEEMARDLNGKISR